VSILYLDTSQGLPLSLPKTCDSAVFHYRGVDGAIAGILCCANARPEEHSQGW
jgi:hypothetical protein